MTRILLLLHLLMNFVMGEPLPYLPILILFTPSNKNIDDDVDVDENNDDAAATT